MKRTLLLLLALLLPATASAYVVFDINCDNVTDIRIERHRDPTGNITSYGWYHTVHYELKPEAAKEFTRLRDTTPKIPVKYRDNRYLRVNIHIISQRHQLPLRASALTTYGDSGPTLVAVREQEAFQLAKDVCPALVPAQVLVEGRLMDPDPANPPVPEVVFPPPTGELVFDLSCDNVAEVLIVRETAEHFPRARAGHVFAVSFRLKPAAADHFQPIVDESRKLTPRPGAPGEFMHRRIAVTTGAQPLPSDIPEIEVHSGRNVNTFFFRKADALDVARLVCPTAPVLLFPPLDSASR